MKKSCKNCKNQEECYKLNPTKTPCSAWESIEIEVDNMGKGCKNCFHFPCDRKESDINNKNGCKYFKSITQQAIDIINKCNRKGD